jgi:hypothetical protein
LSNDSVLPDTWSFMYCHALGRILLQEVSRSTRGSCMDKLTEWEAQFGSLQASVVAWSVWTPLAHALVRGTWYGDVSPRFERDNAGGYLQAPVMPSQRLLRLFASLPCDDIARPDCAASEVSRVLGRMGSESMPVNALMAAVRLGASLKSQRSMQPVVTLATSLVPGAAPVLTRDGINRLPSRTTLHRARVRLDVAAMLFHRWQFAQDKRQLFRYIAYDASPQRGVEIFVVVERIIHVDACGANAAVRNRRLPLVTLGHGRCSLLDKVQAHIHQTWLDYGPTMCSLTRANSVARQCLSDQGTEFAIADVSDVTHSGCIHVPCRCLARSTSWIPFSKIRWNACAGGMHGRGMQKLCASGCTISYIEFFVYMFA